MKNIIFGAIAGLALGTIGALAYSHYLGDGQLLADLQAKLDAANADLVKAKNDKQQLAKEASSISDQVDQLQAANENLKHQVDKTSTPADTATAPAINPMTLANMMRSMFRGGGFQGQQRMFLLQNRLKLTPDQAAKIKAAMDADAQARRTLFQQMRNNNGKIDPTAAAAANTLDQTLATVLTPEQQTAYQQVQADEKTSRADTSATSQVNQIVPLLQLSDTQKDQVFNALYQIQMTAPDPGSLMTNPDAASIMTTQAQATDAALAKVLTPDQMALYQQGGQSVSTGGGFGGRQRGGGADGGTAPATSGAATIQITPASAAPPPQPQ